VNLVSNLQKTDNSNQDYKIQNNSIASTKVNPDISTNNKLPSATGTLSNTSDSNSKYSQIPARSSDEKL
jgi:hypothetical protein